MHCRVDTPEDSAQLIGRCQNNLIYLSSSIVFKNWCNLLYLSLLLLIISDASIKLKLGTGILIAVPIPKEQAASGSLIESAIQLALKEARLVFFSPWISLFLI